MRHWQWMRSSFLAGLMIAGNAAAQHQIEGSFGLAVPTGELSDSWNSSLGLGGGLLFEVTPFAMAGFTLGYDQMGLDRQKLEEETGVDKVDGGDFSTMRFCGEVRAKTGTRESLVAYVGAGAGLYRIAMSDMSTTLGSLKETTSFESENKIGGYFTGGIVIPVTNELKLGGKTEYNIFSVGEDMGFEDVSEVRSFFTLKLTTVYFF